VNSFGGKRKKLGKQVEQITGDKEPQGSLVKDGKCWEGKLGRRSMFGL